MNWAYQQEPYTPFVPKKTVPSFTDLMAQPDNTPESSKAVGLPDESAYGFIGRDYEILRLERAFRQNHLVLVLGMGGVGKTELAAGFARWLNDTQGRTGGMFFTSFEQGAGLSQVINQIGRALGGERFSQMMPEQQDAVVRQYLQTLEEQNNYADALQFYIQVLGNDIKHRHNEEWIYEDIQCLARMLQQLGESQFQAIWHEVTGEECAGEVREAIWTARDRLG